MMPQLAQVTTMPDAGCRCCCCTDAAAAAALARAGDGADAAGVGATGEDKALREEHSSSAVCSNTHWIGHLAVPEAQLLCTNAQSNPL
jgi:hypothetical protein